MITTIVLAGANTHGVMYAGAIRYLVEKGWHESIKTIIGSSSGAIVGFMLALGLSPDQIDCTLLNVFCDIGIPCVSVTRLFKMWSTLGILGNEWKKEYLRNVLKNETGLNDINFEDFAELTGKNIIVVGSNITTHKQEAFSHATTPKMSIIEALDITSCIPVAMIPVMYKGSIYADGSLYNYLPTDLASPEEKDTTLVLYSPLLEKSPIPTNLYHYLKEVMYSLVYVKYHENTTRFPLTLAFQTDEPASSVDTLNFTQKIVSFPRDSIQRMITQGYEQLKEFLSEQIVNNASQDKTKTKTKGETCQDTNQREITCQDQTQVQNESQTPANNADCSSTAPSSGILLQSSPPTR